MNNMLRIKKWLSWVGRSGQARNLAPGRSVIAQWFVRHWSARRRLVALSATLAVLSVGWIQGPQGAPPDVDAVEGSRSLAEVVPRVLAGLEGELANAQLPIDVNERVEHWMVRFSTSHRPAFEETLSRAGLYSDMIRGKLRDRGHSWLDVTNGKFQDEARIGTESVSEIVGAVKQLDIRKIPVSVLKVAVLPLDVAPVPPLYKVDGRERRGFAHRGPRCAGKVRPHRCAGE